MAKENNKKTDEPISGEIRISRPSPELLKALNESAAKNVRKPAQEANFILMKYFNLV